MKRALSLLCLCVCCLVFTACPRPQPGSVPGVRGQMLLRNLAGNAETRLMDVLDGCREVAGASAAQEPDWPAVKALLEARFADALSGIAWYALADGSYWTVLTGAVEANLSDRDYWPTLMEGGEVLGAPVVSKSTGRSAAVFAAPVLAGGEVVAVVGYSVFLDNLVVELAGPVRLCEGYVFFLLDPNAVNMGDSSDLGLIFDEPLTNPEAPQSLKEAIAEIMAGEAGTVTYEWQGVEKGAAFRLMPELGWRCVVSHPAG